MLEVPGPVIERGEVLGNIRYGFSIEPLREAVAKVREQSEQNLETSVLMIGLAVLLSHARRLRVERPGRGASFGRCRA